jgi:hypothetical protein
VQQASSAGTGAAAMLLMSLSPDSADSRNVPAVAGIHACVVAVACRAAIAAAASAAHDASARW